jgi:aspartate/methionine/tyrosine aminotransferase
LGVGQGFPTLPAPPIVLNATKKAIENGIVQYTRSLGHPRLVKALAAYLSPSFQRDIDPMTEIVTTVGATEALLLATLAVINPGDQAMLIEPYYDSYPGKIGRL